MTLSFPFESLKTRTVDGIPDLFTVVAQDAGTRDILMVAYATREAVEKTLESKTATYYSTSRRKLWTKGESSGNTQRVVSVCVDCDGDALLYLVEPQGIGAACHTGYRTCFYREFRNGKLVARGERLFDPDEVYGKK